MTQRKAARLGRDPFIAVAAAASAFVAACSSAGAGAPEAAERSPASGAGPDTYGYHFEDDAVGKASAPSPAPSAPGAGGTKPGRLAPEAIQHVVRQSFGAFRQCYEAGLARNAKLAGTIAVSFVITQQGAVAEASDKDSTLPDAETVACVVSKFKALSFPPPQGGVVTVVYPIVFAP